MNLLISEKPSVAAAIAKVLGANKRRDGCFEGGDWLISWCVGHLVELAPADAYAPQYSKWSRADLPIIPEKWQYRVLPATKKQYDILAALMNDGRVSEICCATDAGREGELIFRLVYELCGCTKPVKRLWISSMEESAIRKGLADLRDSAAYDSLYQAALCRSKADWLIGINATRLFSLVSGKTLTVGRVMTPTLALLTEREETIKNFKKEKYYTVELTAGDLHAASERFSSKSDAQKLRVACVGRPVTVRKVESQEKKENPPKLYDLTTLQREANRLFDYSAQQTLDYAQTLYEKHLLTYPRTDSRYLTEDMGEALPSLCESVRKVLPFAGDTPADIHAGLVLNSAGVSDHHALMPTEAILKADLSSLPTGERNILYMVCVRLLCAVDAPRIYSENTVTLECDGVLFNARGTQELSAGWKETERAFFATLKGKKERSTPPPPLPPMTEGNHMTGAEAAVRESSTNPPKRFTEDTLLSAMERAGAEDFAKLEDHERAGLGTPATRAGIIEKLIRTGLVQRDRKQLVPTEKGVELIRTVPEALKSPKLTSDQEEKLSEVQRGMLSPEDFMSGVVAMLDGLVGSYKDIAAPRPSRPVVGVCPRCGKNVVEGKKSFFCEGYYDKPSCGFARWKNDRFFTGKKKELDKRIASSLLKHGRVRMTNLFSEKKGVLYDATVVMEDTGGKFVRFHLEFDKSPKINNERK